MIMNIMFVNVFRTDQSSCLTLHLINKEILCIETSINYTHADKFVHVNGTFVAIYFSHLWLECITKMPLTPTLDFGAFQGGDNL